MIIVMKIHRISPKTGMLNTMDIDITLDQIDRWQNGELIQNVMPNISAEQREFIISGLLPEEFEDIFKEEEDQ
jgi:hypothetical protein